MNPELLSLCGDSAKPSPLWGEGRVRGEVREAPGPYARRLRRDQTDDELKLWWRLRNRQLCEAKFRRQHPVGSFIVDFCCPEQGSSSKSMAGITRFSVKLMRDARPGLRAMVIRCCASGTTMC